MIFLITIFFWINRYWRGELNELNVGESYRYDNGRLASLAREVIETKNCRSLAEGKNVGGG